MKIALSILWVTGTIFTAQSGRSKTVLIRQGTAFVKTEVGCTVEQEYLNFQNL